MRERLEAAGIDRCSEPSKGRPQPKLFLLLFFYPTFFGGKNFHFSFANHLQFIFEYAILRPSKRNRAVDTVLIPIFFKGKILG